MYYYHFFFYLQLSVDGKKRKNGTGHESGTLVKRIEELIVLESAIHSWPEYIT